jgi:hypothetical protein
VSDTIQDVYNSLSGEQKDAAAIIFGAIASEDTEVDENTEVSDGATIGDIFDALSDLQQEVLFFIAGGIESQVTHTDPVSNFLAHHGVKGMRWGVRRSDVAAARATGKPVQNGRPDAGSGTPLSKSLHNSPINRAVARQIVKEGHGTLEAAHVAALKSTGHRVANGFLGDKTYWKHSAILAGVGVTGLAAAMVAPGLLPAGALASVGVHALGLYGGAHPAGIVGYHFASQAAASAAGKVLVGKAIATATSVVTGVGNTSALVTNTARAVRGNARINKSYAQLGHNLTSHQATGSKKIAKVLKRNGGIKIGHGETSPMETILAAVDPTAEENFLKHHGRKGMKWGQHLFRRDSGSGGGNSSGGKSSQNADGDPTKSSAGQSSNPAEVGHVSADAERFIKTHQKQGVEMSDREIQEAVKRANLVKQYDDIFNPGPNSELKAKVEQLQLQRDYSQLKAQMKPPSTVQRLIKASSTGFDAYAKLNKATDGELNKALKKALLSPSKGKHVKGL